VWAVAAFALALTGLARSAAGEQPTKPPVVRALAFSPDGKVIVAGYGGKDQPGGVAAWDVAGRKRVWHRPEPTGALSVRFAPDGRSLTVARGTPAAVRLEPANGQPLGELGPHPADVRSVAYVLGGDLLATASDGIIRLWDVKAGTVRKELTGHPHEVTSLVASPTGRWLVSIGPDTTRVWDVAAGEDLKGVIRQDRGIAHRGIAFFGPDWLQMGDNSGVQRITELPAGKEVLRFHNAGGCDGAAYSPAAGLAAFRWSGSPYVSIADLTFRPPAADEQVRIDKLLKDFDDDSYAVREAGGSGRSSA
jgi:WD40 repeat protein